MNKISDFVNDEFGIISTIFRSLIVGVGAAAALAAIALIIAALIVLGRLFAEAYLPLYLARMRVLIANMLFGKVRERRIWHYKLVYDKQSRYLTIWNLKRMNYDDTETIVFEDPIYAGKIG